MCCTHTNPNRNMHVFSAHTHVFVRVREFSSKHAIKINIPAHFHSIDSSQTMYSYVVCLSRVSKLTCKKALSKLHLMPVAISQVLDRVFFYKSCFKCLCACTHVIYHRYISLILGRVCLHTRKTHTT